LQKRLTLVVSLARSDLDAECSCPVVLKVADSDPVDNVPSSLTLEVSLADCEAEVEVANPLVLVTSDSNIELEILDSLIVPEPN